MKYVTSFQFPASEAEWKYIADVFEERCNFPNCVGAVDGKYVRIKPPSGSGAFYYNYKGYNSLVLMAICNANYEFIMCDFGVNGRISDGGVISSTRFYRKLQNGTIKLPSPSHIKSNVNRKLPYVFVGDEAFALRSDFLKPYAQKDLTHDKKIFNYRLSRARCRIENAFGILAARFQIFQTAIDIRLQSIDKVVMACCVLHNYLRQTCGGIYAPPDSLDKENTVDGSVELGLRANPDQLAGLQRGYIRNYSAEANLVRQSFMQYFTEDGAVSWQERMIS